MRAKICGITETKDALDAARYGAWAVGFIFYKKSKRFIGPYKAKKIIASLPPFLTTVGIFVDQKEGAVKQIADFCGLHAVQFHGDETPAYCKRFTERYRVIKTFRVHPDFSLEIVRPYKSIVSAFLFDSYSATEQGGSGQTFNWKLIKEVKDFNVPIIVSGGLNPQNVRAAVQEVHPYAVDVSSGVETQPGKKSPRLIEDFLNQLIIPISA